MNNKCSSLKVVDDVKVSEFSIEGIFPSFEMKTAPKTVWRIIRKFEKRRKNKC